MVVHLPYDFGDDCAKASVNTTATMEYDPVYRLGGKTEYTFTQVGEDAACFSAVSKGTSKQQIIHFHTTKATPECISGTYTTEGLEDEGTFWLKRPGT